MPSVPTGWARVWSLQGSALPPHLVLLARALGICVVLREWWHPAGVFLPFVGDAEATGSAVTWSIRLTVLGLGLLLALNRLVAPSAFALGTVLLLQIAGSRVYYANNRTFTALVLVLVGLCATTKLPLVRYQVVLLYAAAALNKALDTDWRSGRYLDAFAATSSILDRTLHAVPGLETRTSAQLLSCAVILLEVALALAFCVPRLFPFAIFTGIAYHTGLVLTAQRTFGLFWYATAVSYLAFVRWPSAPLDVHMNPGRRGHRFLRAVLSRFDPDGGLAWHDSVGPFRTGAGRSGVVALLAACVRLPAFLLGVLGLLALPHARYDVACAGLVLLALVVFAAGYVRGLRRPRMPVLVS